MKVDRRGSRNPNAVLTPVLVAEMKRMHAIGFGYGWIATWFSVTKSCAQKVLTGRTWKAKKRK
jgi:hypothetical protein